MKSSLPNPTKAEVRRFQLMTMEIGCIPCLQEGFGYNPADVQHIVDGGKRISHSHTYPACPWHHRGIRKCPELNYADNKAEFGPSLALSKIEYRETYGTELELLEETNRRLEELMGDFV